MQDKVQRLKKFLFQIRRPILHKLNISMLNLFVSKTVSNPTKFPLSSISIIMLSPTIIASGGRIFYLFKVSRNMPLFSFSLPASSEVTKYP